MIGTCRAMPDKGSGVVAYYAAVPEGTQVSLKTMFSTISTCYLAQKACEAGFVRQGLRCRAKTYKLDSCAHPSTTTPSMCGERDGNMYDNPCYRFGEQVWGVGRTDGQADSPSKAQSVQSAVRKDSQTNQLIQ